MSRAAKPQSPPNPRAIATMIVAAVIDDGRDLDSAIEQQIPPAMDHRDRALARRLAYTTLRWLPALQFLAGQLLSKPIAAKERLVERLLWVGLAQLWREDMPSHAVVHSTVAAAQSLGKGWSKGLLNACLRRYLREKTDLHHRLQQDRAEYALPEDWLNQLEQDWPRRWQEIVAASHAEPPLWLRVNRSRIDRDSYLHQLQQEGIAAQAGAPADAVLIQQPCPVDELPGFAHGLVAVQDAAAQWAVDALELAPGLHVLDACAAPGGKTCHILERQPQLARLVAVDRDARRVQRIHDNLRRLGLDQSPIIDVRCSDATDSASWADEPGFDRILLDAPCSAAGVIRRHPDIPWRRRIADLAHLNRLQAQLLRALWPLLNPGGMLVYATCSIFASENQQPLQEFLNSHADARPHALPHWGVARGVGRQCLPGVDGMDGFYYAALRRVADQRLPAG